MRPGLSPTPVRRSPRPACAAVFTTSTWRQRCRSSRPSAVSTPARGGRDHVDAGRRLRRPADRRAGGAPQAPAARGGPAGLAIETVGGMSRGSLRTAFRDLRRGDGVKRCGGELVPARPGEERLVLDLRGGGRRAAVTDPWRGDLASAWWSSVYPEIDVYTVYPAMRRWLLRSALASP